nr:Fumarate reductase [Ipomoea batatas]
MDAMVKNRGAAEQIFVAILLLDCSGRETAIEGKESDENESRDIQRGGGGLSVADAVLPLRRGDNLDLHAARRQCSEFLAHPVSNSPEHGGAATEDNVSIQILPDVHVALHDRVVCSLVNASSFHSYHRRLEKDFWAAETL